MTYAEYLQTPHWKALRSKKLAEAGEQCNRCGALNMLEVHHIYYMKSWWRTELKHLEVLCADCHELHHKNFKRHRPIIPAKKARGRNIAAFRNPYRASKDQAVVARY